MHDAPARDRQNTGNVDTEGIKALDGVMGLVEDDTMRSLGPAR
ncbi:MAG: hypothetical protein ACLTYW_02960 [Collinsella sp.]